MPSYNEEANIIEAMRRVEAFMGLKNWKWELIISDDGSKDSTARLVQSVIESHPEKPFRLLACAQNLGKGAAVRSGVLAARGEVTLVTDVDLSAPIKEVDRLIKALDEGNDVVIGSRAIRSNGCDVQQSFKRWFSGRIFNQMVRLIFLKGFRDTQCGFKCFKRQAANQLFSQQKLNGFSFDVEILYLAKKGGFKIKELPVMWRQAPTSRVSLLKDSFGMIRELFALRRIYSR